MSSNGEDPNPWYFGNEMTIDGCQGWRNSAPASSANGDTSNSGKPPASDGQPPAQDPNANTGAGRRRSLRKHKNSPSVSDNRQGAFQSLRDDVPKPDQYTFSNGDPNQRPSSALSREHQLKSSPGQRIPEQGIPRSWDLQLDTTLIAEYCAKRDKDSPQSQGQGQELTTGMEPESSKFHQGARDSLEPKDQQGPRTIEQHPQETESPAQEYRQPDTDHSQEDDAETDEEPSRDPKLDGKGRGN
ncbi:hypothetical protein N431DRAFT_380169 [Stipitochalara longipes BDJ]|nr:hypothetical protein N431DRAFT_380169 [Stipitochalara longipes BDJ]